MRSGENYYEETLELGNNTNVDAEISFQGNTVEEASGEDFTNSSFLVHFKNADNIENFDFMLANEDFINSSTMGKRFGFLAISSPYTLIFIRTTSLSFHSGSGEEEASGMEEGSAEMEAGEVKGELWSTEEHQMETMNETSTGNEIEIQAVGNNMNLIQGQGEKVQSNATKVIRGQTGTSLLLTKTLTDEVTKIIQSGCDKDHTDLFICESYFNNYLFEVSNWAKAHDQVLEDHMWKACMLLSLVERVPSSCCTKFQTTCASFLEFIRRRMKPFAISNVFMELLKLQLRDQVKLLACNQHFVFDSRETEKKMKKWRLLKVAIRNKQLEDKLISVQVQIASTKFQRHNSKLQ
uniref:DDE-1 domain-containing protein n=1 Tax=Angiostrongylus costaricensis TaxID=334426 RepID=A0A158PGV5_ANGCS